MGPSASSRATITALGAMNYLRFIGLNGNGPKVLSGFLNGKGPNPSWVDCSLSTCSSAKLCSSVYFINVPCLDLKNL